MGQKGRWGVKYIALAILVVQNSSLVLMMRYSRIHASEEGLYFSSTAVLCAEVLKLIVSSWLSFALDSNGSLVDFKRLISQEFIIKWKEFALLGVPAGLYVIQNNLQYLASSNLPADVFQVLSNLKIVTTALMSVVMLSRSLSQAQWISVLALTAGIGIVQMSFASAASSGTKVGQHPFFGFMCVLVMVSISGFAGVFFEKVLKTTVASVWVRNIQLALIGIVISGIACVARDGGAIAEKGFFFGYDWTVYSTICLSALGGLVVAVVVKFADNVVKGFATAIALVISSFVSIAILRDSDFSLMYLVGASIVLGSSFMYSTKSASVTEGNAAKYEAVSSSDKDLSDSTQDRTV